MHYLYTIAREFRGFCTTQAGLMVYCWSLAREFRGIIKVQKQILTGVIYVKDTIGK